MYSNRHAVAPLATTLLITAVFSAVIKTLRVHCNLLMSCMPETPINKGLLPLRHARLTMDGALCSRRYPTLPTTCAESAMSWGAARGGGASRGGGRAPIALKHGCMHESWACSRSACSARLSARRAAGRRRPNAVPIANVLLIYYSCMTMCNTNTCDLKSSMF